MNKFYLSMMMAAGLTLAPALQAKTFVFCSEASPEGFNPQLFESGTTFDAAAHTLYDTLYKFIKGTTDVEPGLAESYTVSPDGLEYTFVLRKGVKFHTTDKFKPTRDFNADDVIFSFKRAIDVNHPFHKIGGKYPYYQGMEFPKLIKDIVKIDDYNLKFVLNKPESPFIANLAMPFASILSAEYADQLIKAGTPERIDLDPVGTGPFILQAYQKDAIIRYKRNDQYWKAPAKIDTLVFAITPNPSVRYQKLQAGECHLMPYPNPAEIEKMKVDPKITLLSQEGLNIGNVDLNTTRKPFDDVRVRRALSHAINTPALVKAVYQDSGTVAKNFIPPTLWSYKGDLPQYEYNPEKAKALLKEAGVAEGAKFKLYYSDAQRPYMPNFKLTAELVQADLKKVGIEVEPYPVEWSSYLATLRRGEHDMSISGWTGDNGDPDNFFQPLRSCDAAANGSNYAKWCDKAFDELVAAARRESDKAKRTELYQKVQVYLNEQAPGVNIAHSVTYVPMRKEVTGFKVSPLGDYDFYAVDISE